MKNSLLGNRGRSQGSALLIVLAFLLLLTTLTIAFLSRATLERQLSNGSFGQGKVDLAGQGAIVAIVGDLQQEIVAGSNGTGTPTVYYPSSPLTATPSLVVPGYTSLSIVNTGLEDLLKISYPSPFYSGGTYTGTAPNRASSVATTTASLNNRSISPVRWNKPLLMAKLTPTSTDFTPVAAFTAPDWIYVARDGSNPTTLTTANTFLPNVAPTTATSATAGTNPITQRYAYAIYDEGSTLDMNFAGSPVTAATTPLTYSTLQPYKNALAYADLTQLPGLNSLSPTAQMAFINAIVGWRNFASTGLSGNTYTFPYTSSIASTTQFDQNLLLSSMNGFLGVGGTQLSKGPNVTGMANQSDNAFSSRQQLLQFFLQGLGQNSTFTANVPLSTLQNVMPYLGTFSRDISQPSYAPPTGRPVVLPTASGGNTAVTADATVNPSLLNVTVQSGKTFPRNDGTTAVAGEPLLKKRFALNRLAWITYQGPSATRTQTDVDIQAFIADGIPWSYLQQGTAANIKAYFGLSWDATNHVWDYNVHNGASGAGTKGAIMQLGAIANLTTPHDPDFFEILKATIGVGSLGKALSPSNSTVAAAPGASLGAIEQPANYNWYVESSVDIHIIQIGANMIAQAQPAYYPPQIVFDDGVGGSYVPRTIVGVENLPYLTAVMNGVLLVQPPNPLPRNGQPTYSGTLGSGVGGSSGYDASDTIITSGAGAWMQLPVIWNPYDPACPPGVVGPKNFRVVADSARPDIVRSGGTYNKFFVYGTSQPTSQPTSYSYAAASSSPGFSWYGDISGTGTGIAHQFMNPNNAHGNAEVDFTVTPAATPAEICPEPMILMRPATVKDTSLSGANSIAVSVPSTHLMNTDPAVNSPTVLVTGGGLPNYVPNAPQMQAPESLDPANTSYVGFYLGAFPLAWVSASGIPCSTGQSGAYLSRAGLSGNPAGDTTSCYMTYRMQYQDPNNGGNWITYDTKYGLAYDGSVIGGGVCPANANNGNVAAKGVLVGVGDWAFATDPRTSRFGLMSTHPSDTLVGSGGQGVSLPGPELDFWGSTQKYGAGWLDTANGLLYTTRPDGQSGFYCKTGWPSAIGPSSGWMAYIGSDNNNYSGLAPGLLSQNNTDIFYVPHTFYGDTQGANTFTPNYFADADGMVRRGMGAFVPLGTAASPEAAGFNPPPPADTTVGLPMARTFNWNTYTPPSPNLTITNYTGAAYSTAYPLSHAQSRPYFLHRPYYSVAELGYVFSDTPWRNLDFSTPESGNVALLDAFCVGDTNDARGLVAGKVDLNTRQAPVLAAVIAEGCLDPVAPTLTGNGTVGQIDSTTAGLVAKALVARTTDTTNVSNGTGPLQNLSDLVGKWEKNIAINDLGGLITGTDKGTLGNGFYDGKLSYAGFSGGVWDTSNHTPYKNGFEDFTTGAPQATSPSGTAEDIYSAYMNSGSFTSNANHNGSRETVTNIQRFRESPIRALAAAGTTRVWNLMIDVIAQTGRFPSSAGSLANFNVEGERRYWVHVAIDRYTGKVLDEQIEEVKE
jgi:hypothetical protein